MSRTPAPPGERRDQRRRRLQRENRRTPEEGGQPTHLRGCGALVAVATMSTPWMCLPAMAELLVRPRSSSHLARLSVLPQRTEAQIQMQSCRIRLGRVGRASELGRVGRASERRTLTPTAPPLGLHQLAQIVPKATI